MSTAPLNIISVAADSYGIITLGGGYLASGRLPFVAIAAAPTLDAPAFFKLLSAHVREATCYVEYPRPRALSPTYSSTQDAMMFGAIAATLQHLGSVTSLSAREWQRKLQRTDSLSIVTVAAATFPLAKLRNTFALEDAPRARALLLGACASKCVVVPDGASYATFMRAFNERSRASS
jgi:hypothetical protein